MMIRSSRIRTVAQFLLAILAALLVLEAVVSLRWRMNHDAPILYYVAMLVDKYGYVPYRDVFETSFPGTILFYAVLVKAVGYSDLAFRIVDLLWLSALLAVTVLLLQRFGRTAALMSAALFGLTYLGSGSMMSMQREYIALLPIALALYVATRHERRNSWQELALIGGCFGFAAAIKPQLALGIIPVLVYVAVAKEDSARGMAAALKQIVLRGLQAATGFVLVAAIPFVWVWQRGGLPAFLDMANHYLPLYLQLTGERELLSTGRRIAYVVKAWRMSHAGYWIGAVAGFYIMLERIQALDEHAQRRYAAVLFLLLAELAIYSLCPAIAGQFWINHWLPFLWCSCVLTGLLIVPALAEEASASLRISCLALLLLFLVMGLRYPVQTVAGRTGTAPELDRTDVVVNYLAPRLQPDDTVQTFDSVEGGNHALLLLHARLATPYICDFYFYHHEANPVIQVMRKRFVDALSMSRPRFIVDSVTKLRMRGVDKAYRYPELDTFMKANYHEAFSQAGMIIYERNN